MGLRYSMIALIVMLLIAGSAMADGPVGTWKGEALDSPITIVISESDGKLKGTIKSKLGVTNLRKLSVFNDRISFEFDFENEGRKISVVYTGTLEENGIRGNALSRDIGSFDVDLTPAAPESNLHLVVGTWEGETGQGPITVIINETDGALGGTVESSQGKTDLSDVTFADGEVTFVVNIDIGGEAVSLGFKGAIDGDSFDGQIEVPGAGEFPLTMTRSAEAVSDLKLAVGRWEGTTDQGPVAIVITEADGVLAGEIETGLGIDALSDVVFADGKLSFSATLDFGGEAVPLAFEGPIDGDSYGANVDIEGLGQFPIAMTRAAGSAMQAADMPEPIPAPDVVVMAIENWGELPSHVRKAIEGLAAGEVKDWEESKDE